MNDVSTVLHVQLLADQPRESIRHVEFHFDQPLLTQDSLRAATPGKPAVDDCTPLMEGILRELYGATDLGVTQVFIGMHHLAIDHFAALNLDRILSIIDQSASAVGLSLQLSDDL